MIVQRFVVVLLVMFVFVGCGLDSDDPDVSTTKSVLGVEQPLVDSGTDVVVDSQPSAVIDNDVPKVDAAIIGVPEANVPPENNVPKVDIPKVDVSKLKLVDVPEADVSH